MKFKSLFLVLPLLLIYQTVFSKNNTLLTDSIFTQKNTIKSNMLRWTWHISDMAADYVFVGDHDIDFELPGTLGVLYNYNSWKVHKKGYPFFTTNEYLNENLKSKKLNMI